MFLAFLRVADIEARYVWNRCVRPCPSAADAQRLARTMCGPNTGRRVSSIGFMSIHGRSSIAISPVDTTSDDAVRPRSTSLCSTPEDGARSKPSACSYTDSLVPRLVLTSIAVLLDRWGLRTLLAPMWTTGRIASAAEEHSGGASIRSSSYVVYVVLRMLSWLNTQAMLTTTMWLRAQMSPEERMRVRAAEQLHSAWMNDEPRRLAEAEEAELGGRESGPADWRAARQELGLPQLQRPRCRGESHGSSSTGTSN